MWETISIRWTPALMRVVLLIDRGSEGVERGIILPEYSESVVDGVGVLGVGEGRDKGLRRFEEGAPAA
jgi:hypothetical protein